MSRASHYDKACLLISQSANQLGHNAKGHQGRWWANGFLGLSAILGAGAGSAGLADLISKTWVSLITLAATISTAFAIFLLTTLKYDAHLRAQGKYAYLFSETVKCDMETETGQSSFSRLWDDFGNVVREVDTEQASLSNRQVRKYENKARKQLDIGMRATAEILTDPPPEHPSGLDGPSPLNS